MKLASIFKTKSEWILFFSIVFLSGVSLINPFHDHLLSFLLHSVEEVSLSIGVIFEIKSILAVSSHIPLIGGSLSHIDVTFQEILKYLTWSDMIITSQMILIKLSNSIIFKIVLLLSIGSLFISSSRSIGLKMIIMLLLINPGLPAYVTVTKFIAQEMKLGDASQLHSQIQEIHQKYHKKKIEQKGKKALEEKSNDSKLKKLEDKVLNEGRVVVNKVEELSAESLAIIKSGGKEILIQSINYIVTVAFQFLLLPFLFLYAVLQILKRFLSSSVPESVLQKMTFSLLIGVLISFTTLAWGTTEKKEQAKTQKKAPLTETLSQDAQMLGIDVSHFQGDVNWEEIKSANISFAYAKATQGTAFIDPKFDRNWREIKENGLIRGSYHFYVAGEDPEKQANLYIKTVGQLGEYDMPPVLDLEQGGMKPGVNKDTYKKNVLLWLSLVEKALGKKPLIYTDYPFGNAYLTDKRFGEYGLWIADWQKRKEPQVPNAWNGKWTIWQRSETGSIEGEVGNVDHDLFNGSKKELEKLN